MAYELDPSAREAALREGVDPTRLSELLERVRADVEGGRLEAAQVAVARHHSLVAFETFGEATQGNVSLPATNDTLFAAFSCSKAVIGASFWKLIEDGRVSIDDRIVRHIPEFGANGKDEITLKQVLAHLGGFPSGAIFPSQWSTSEGRRSAMARWKPEIPAGTAYVAHAFAGHWVLVELIESLTGVDYRKYVRDFVESAGVDDYWLGVPPQLHARIADVVWRGDPRPGSPGPENPEILLYFNGEEARAQGIPGGPGYGTARSLAMFFQPLIHDGTGPNGQILKADTIRLATEVVTGPEHVDEPLTGLPVNRALSVNVAGENAEERTARGFGATCSPRAFGHGGMGGQIAWGDPETGLSFAYCTNTMTAFSDWRARAAELSTLAAATLPQ